MLRAAILGALAAINPGPRRRKLIAVDTPGYHVELSGQARHPERMDDVVGLQDELDGNARRDADFVCRRELSSPDAAM